MDRPRLRLKRGNIELVGLALILMLLGSFVMVSSPRPRDNTPREYLRTHSVSFSVSLDDSEWNYTIYGMVTRVGITDMETNGTPVGIIIQDRNNATVFEISNVNQISNSSLVAQASDDFKIIVTRESGNANGSFVIAIWELIPIPLFDADFIRVVPNYFLLSVLAMILIWRIVTAKTARRSIRPAWVAVLVLIGLVLIAPYLSGFAGGYFIPTKVTEQVYFDRRTLLLNGTIPNSLVPFGNEVPDSAESFRIHSFEDDNKKYHFELVGANGELLLSATHQNSSIAWEILGESVSQEHSLSLDRVDIDVDVSLSIEASATIVRIPVDTLPNLILAVAGFIALILAIAAGFSVQTREKVGQY
jgi:hypothetical protein